MEYELTIFKLMNMFMIEYLCQNKYPTQQNNERNNASKYPVSHFHGMIPFKKLNNANIYQSPKNNTPWQSISNWKKRNLSIKLREVDNYWRSASGNPGAENFNRIPLRVEIFV